jgi:hypothetical protein
MYIRDAVADAQAAVHRLAKEKGWWDDVTYPNANDVAAKIALVHSELSEALEELREFGTHGIRNSSEYAKGSKPEGFGIELGDAVIRILDLAAALGIDLGVCMEIKHNYNATRPYRHGGKAL